MLLKKRPAQSPADTTKTDGGRRFLRMWPKTWPWRISCVLVLVLIAYSAGAYFGVPALLRYFAQHQAAIALHRSVTVGEIKFNPYTLGLSVADLNVGGRGGSPRFIQIDQVSMRLSWRSLYKLSLVVKELAIERPLVRVERLRASTFNFSDLLESSSSNRMNLSFAISNLEVSHGRVLFDDQVLRKQYRLDNVRLAIPFIANLPIDADIYVQPMLQMTVNGSPFSLIGKTRPFRGSRESIVELSLQKLDLTRFTGYVAQGLPFKLQRAELTATLQFHFFQTPVTPELQTAGTVRLDNVVLNDLHDLPLAQSEQLQAAIADFDPFTAKLDLSSIVIESLASRLVINHDGSTNLSSLISALAPPPGSALTQTKKRSASHNPNTKEPTPLLNPLAAAPSGTVPGTSSSSSASGQNTQSTANSRFRLSVASLEINNGTLDIRDNTTKIPTATKLEGIDLALKNLATVGGSPAAYRLSANLRSGGRLTAEGKLDLSSWLATGKVGFVNIDLPPLRDLAALLMPATISSGALSGQASVRVTLESQFNLHADSAQITLDGVELRPPNQPRSIMGWKHLAADVDQVDLASRQAIVRELHGNGLHLTALIDSQGNLNLASLINAPAPAADENPHTEPQNGSSPWQYRIESLVLENSDAVIEDDTQNRPFSIQIAPFNLSAKGLTSDFAKPFEVECDGNTPRKGSFKLTGETAISPFASRLHINTDRFDLGSLEPIISNALAPDQLNAKITHARLGMDGDVKAQIRDSKFNASYQGNATLDHVRISDKVTGVSFLRWDTLNVDKLMMRYGPPRLRLEIGKTALSAFYAALILNADGRLNLANVISSPAQPPAPVTRPTVKPHGENATPATSADITVGSFTLRNGEVNYRDNFIKPNYSAVLTQVQGRIGGFGTDSAQPAEVALSGNVNRTSPVSVTGSINPLTPMASLDLEGSARRVDLPPLTPYAAKYTGYPITGGTLSGNVHYKLGHKHLTATNHLILDQLRFGEHVQNSSAGNLPIRLAIAVLKDSQGRIDLRIPVSGSLADPNFDLGRLIWQGFENVIKKAATAPFAILASSAGGKKQNLAYIEFAPGYSSLSEPSRNKLEKLSSLLNQRPSLKLQMTGRADPRVDMQGLREAILETEIKRQKANNEHLSTAPAALAQMEVTPDEYVRYLRRVYKAADFAKPRDLLGMAKNLPPDEMKKLLLANIKVTDEDLRHLAQARASTVYESLSARIDRSRLVVAPPKINTEGTSGGATTRVDFSLQ